MAEAEKTNKIDELEKEIKSLKCALVERTKAAQKKATIDVGKIAAELNEGAGKLIDAAQPPIKEAADKAGKKISQHPFVSVTAALAAGILIAGLGRKKQK